MSSQPFLQKVAAAEHAVFESFACSFLAVKHVQPAMPQSALYK